MVGLIPVFLGLVGPIIDPNVENGEQIVPRLMELHLPAVPYVIFAGAVLSAVLSTVDSALLASGSILSLNVIQPVGGTLVREYPLLTTRFAVAGLGLVALVIALRPGTIHDLIMTAASFGRVGLVVVTLFGLSTRIGGAASAAVALLLGGSGVVWRIVLRGYRYTLHLRRSLGSSRLSRGGHKRSVNYCFLTFIEDFVHPAGGSVSGKADR